MVLKTFVDRRRDLTKEELMEYISFCQLLPGASSTQTLTLIGYKRGGVRLAVVTLLIWLFPACFLMGLLSFIVGNLENFGIQAKILRFVQPMAIGFLAYAAYKTYRISINNPITRIILFVSAVITFLLFKAPWVIPALIVCGGVVTNFSSKRIPAKEIVKPRHIRWTNIWLFAILFIAAGVLSETARKRNWEYRREFNLFENFYRFGSIVFGGGDVLIPLMVDQYVARPTSPAVIKRNPDIIRLEQAELLTGAGIVRAIPGPVFSIASFVGGLATKGEGVNRQVVGCIIGSVAIFLPSALLVLFFFPVWQTLKKYVVVYRSLEGINAAVVGIMIAATLYLLKNAGLFQFTADALLGALVFVGTFLTLLYSKTPAPFIVSVSLLIGWLV